MQFSHVQLHSGDGMSKKSLNGETPGAGGPRARGRRHVRPQLADVRFVSLVGESTQKGGLNFSLLPGFGKYGEFSMMLHLFVMMCPGS